MTRQLGPDEKLRHDEMLDTDVTERSAIEVRHAVLIDVHEPLTDYSMSERPTEQVAPGVVKALIRNGLASKLRELGRIVEVDRVGFEAFRREEVIQENVPSFLEMRRGVGFRVDHFSNAGRRSYGSFVSTRVRLSFRTSLSEDELLAAAAEGGWVTVQGLLPARPAKLLSTDLGRGIALVETDSGDRKQVPVKDVRVGAGSVTLRRYCAAIGHPDLTANIHRAAQIGSHRLARSGQRNRRWATEEMAQVRQWLASAAQYDRLPFAWPNTNRSVHMATRPTDVMRAEPE